MNSNNLTYFDSFGAEYIKKDTKEFISYKIIIANVYGIQANVSIICEYFFIGFIDFMPKGKSLLDYTNLSSLNKCEKSDKVILKDFQ